MMEVLDLVIVVVSTFLLGAGFRIRGDSIFERITGRGVTTARLTVWALPTMTVAIAASYLALPWYQCLAVFLATWAGSTVGWGSSIDQGRVSGTKLGDLIMHSFKGAVMTVGIGLVLTSPPVALCGLLFGPVYALGYALSESGRLPHTVADVGGSEWGEMFSGAIVGCAVSLSIILGFYGDPFAWALARLN